MKVALIGLNHPHSLLHLNSFHAIQDIKEVFVWDETNDLGDSLDLNKYNKISYISNNIQEIIDKAPFFAITALRHDLIMNVCILLIDHKINVLAEKPAGLNLEEIKFLYNYSEVRSNKFGVCYINRADPRTKKTKEIIKEGICGKILTIEMRMLTTSVDNRDPTHWLFKKKYSGGGILNWLGCHFIDLIRYILDDEIISVYAEIETYTLNKIDVEDASTLIFRLKNGKIATLQLSYILKLSGSGYNNKSGYDTYVSFNGDQGRIIWSSNQEPLSIYVESNLGNNKNYQKNKHTFTLKNSIAYGGCIGEIFLNNYIQWCLEKEESLTTIYDALINSQIIECAYKSAEKGEKVYINTL